MSRAGAGTSAPIFGDRRQLIGVELRSASGMPAIERPGCF